MTRFLVVIAVLASTAVLAQTPGWPPNGFVPDANTATAIARAVLIPIYGAATIKGEEPLTAERVGDFWFVRGHLQCAPNCQGGVASVQISAKDGAIRHVFHTK
jgi:hypothetical protein